MIRILFWIVSLILMASSGMCAPLVGFGGGTIVPYCSSCPDGTNGGDVVCELFDSSSDAVCGWDAGTQTNCSLSLNATPDNSPELGCQNIDMTYAAVLDKTSTSEGSCFKDFDTGATRSIYYIQFYVKISSEGLASTSQWPILSIAQYSNGYASINFVLYDDSGTLKFKLKYHQSDGWSEDISQFIALDTWYGIRIHYDETGTDHVQWWIDYSNNGTWTDEGETSFVSDRTGPQYVIIGDTGYQASLVKFQISGLKVDDDTMPGSCSM